MDADKTYRRIALVLLFLNGITACWGAAGLLQAPSGEHLSYELSWLEPTPFSDYFWPAIILLVANGVMCLLVAVLALRRVPGYPVMIMFQGVVLLGWLLAEVAWGLVFILLQGIYMAIAIGIIWSGYRLWRLARARDVRSPV